MRASLVWEKFLVENRKIVTSEDVRKLSDELSKDRDRVIDYLQHNGYIVRILKGIFYVKSIEERERKTYNNSIYEMVALALEKKGVKNWYFGLETALKLNTMTHEYFTIDYVLTDSYRTTKVIKILDTSFKFIKRGRQHFKQGIIHKGMIRYSDVEKTVLDLAYRSFLRAGEKQYMSPIKEYKETLDMNRLRDYLSGYSSPFRERVVDAI